MDFDINLLCTKRYTFEKFISSYQLYKKKSIPIDLVQVYRTCVKNGKLKILKWLYHENHVLNNSKISNPFMTELLLISLQSNKICIASWLLSICKKNFNINYDHDFIFYELCEQSTLTTIKWFYKHSPLIDLTYENYYGFRIACEVGKLQLAQWFYLLDKRIQDNIYAMNYSFAYSCFNNYLDVSKWLIEIQPKINIFAEENRAIKYIGSHGTIHTLQYLYNYQPNTMNKYILDHLDFLFRSICKYDKIEIMVWFFEQYPRQMELYISTSMPDLFISLIYSNSIDCLIWLYDYYPVISLNILMKYYYIIAVNETIHKWLHEIKPYHLNKTFYYNFPLKFETLCKYNNSKHLLYTNCTIQPNSLPNNIIRYIYNLI